MSATFLDQVVVRPVAFFDAADPAYAPAWIDNNVISALWTYGFLEPNVVNYGFHQMVAFVGQNAGQAAPFTTGQTVVQRVARRGFSFAPGASKTLEFDEEYFEAFVLQPDGYAYDTRASYTKTHARSFVNRSYVFEYDFESAILALPAGLTLPRVNYAEILPQASITAPYRQQFEAAIKYRTAIRYLLDLRGGRAPRHRWYAFEKSAYPAPVGTLGPVDYFEQNSPLRRGEDTVQPLPEPRQTVLFSGSTAVLDETQPQDVAAKGPRSMPTHVTVACSSSYATEAATVLTFRRPGRRGSVALRLGGPAAKVEVTQSGLTVDGRAVRFAEFAEASATTIRVPALPSWGATDANARPVAATVSFPAGLAARPAEPDVMIHASV